MSEPTTEPAPADVPDEDTLVEACPECGWNDHPNKPQVETCPQCDTHPRLVRMTRKEALSK